MYVAIYLNPLFNKNMLAVLSAISMLLDHLIICVLHYITWYVFSKGKYGK